MRYSLCTESITDESMLIITIRHPFRPTGEVNVRPVVGFRLPPLMNCGAAVALLLLIYVIMTHLIRWLQINAQ